MFKQLKSISELIHRHYTIIHNNSEFNMYISYDKLLVATNIDDYRFNDKTNNFFETKTDIFENIIDDNLSSGHIEAITNLKWLLGSNFNGNKQLANLIRILNMTVPIEYILPNVGVNYKRFIIEY